VTIHIIPIIHTDREVTVMISSVYSYYLSQYGNKSNSKYDSHTRTQLKNTYSKVVKINSQTPVYKLDLSTAAQKYAIDLKEHARALENITEDLSDGADGTMTFKKSAVSSNASAVNASYITDFGAASDDESFDINVKQLACSQLNTGNYLQPRSKHIKPGEYSFDLSINDVIYEFQFKVDNSETTNNIQNKIARLINRSNIGLTANIKEDSLGNTAINIESESTGINGTTPVIFSIKSDDANNQPLIDTLGLDRVTQYPANAIFDVDGDERSSMSNSITINKAYDVKLSKVTEEPVTISLKADADSIVESLNELVAGYNNLISVTNDENNNHFQGTEKLQNEIASIARSYKKQLADSGLSLNKDGTISADKEVIINADNKDALSHIYESLNSFKNSIKEKAENIALNPMDYVNNKIIAYKNPLRSFPDPYNLSAYTGMMFNGYI
jgi:flagellar hook-associated protein 2